MAALMRLLNRLLPFATPGTPLIQDLVHLGVICVALYFAPLIQEYVQRRNQGEGQRHEPLPAEANAVNVAGQDNERAADGEAVEAEDLQEDGPNQAADEINDGPGNADFQAFQRDQINEVNGADPANLDAVNMPQQRNVGAKKAKSLARRDQRRAYHEFQRAQGEAQRAKDAEGASEREAAQAAERERRKAVEAELEAKKAKEREKKREQEKKEREEEQTRRERAVAVVRRELDERRMCNLFDVVKEVDGADVDEVWVERILNANAMLGKKDDGSLTMITGAGWVVRVTRNDMRRAYEKVVEDGAGDENGKIGHDELGPVLEQILKAGPGIAAH